MNTAVSLLQVVEDFYEVMRNRSTFDNTFFKINQNFDI